MRILLTDQGKDLLSLLSVEQDIDKNVIQTEQSKSLIKSHNSIINFSSQKKTLNYTHVMVLRYSNGWELLIRHL